MPADHGNDEGFFGERVAARYDEDAAGMFDPAVVTPVVDTLVELAGQGAALEFGIGTGRIALPLAERGVRVAGIDSSDAMVARLRAKPGGGDIEVAIGDFATTRLGSEFSLVCLVFNTINNLVTQDAARRRAVRDRGRGPRPAEPSGRADHHPLPRRPRGASGSMSTTSSPSGSAPSTTSSPTVGSRRSRTSSATCGPRSWT